MASGVDAHLIPDSNGEILPKIVLRVVYFQGGLGDALVS